MKSRNALLIYNNYLIFFSGELINHTKDIDLASDIEQQPLYSVKGYYVS